MAVLVDYAGAMEVVERVAGPVVVGSIGAAEVMNSVLKCLLSILVVCILPSEAVKAVQWRLRTIADCCSVRSGPAGALVFPSARITERLEVKIPMSDSCRVAGGARNDGIVDRIVGRAACGLFYWPT